MGIKSIFPVESDTFTVTPPALMALPKIRTGDPELKVMALFVPKYQLLNSFWEKPRSEKQTRKAVR